MRVLLAFAALLIGTIAQAQTIYPIDRADILAGAMFDFKVEFPDRIAADGFKVTVNDADIGVALGRPASFIGGEADIDRSALILRNVKRDRPGTYKVRVEQGDNRREITWNVYATGPRRAKNVIL